MTTAAHTHTWELAERRRWYDWRCACGATEPLAQPAEARALRAALAELVAAWDASEDEHRPKQWDARMTKARALLAGANGAGDETGR